MRRLRRCSAASTFLKRPGNVFGNEHIDTSGAVLNRWEEIKNQEKAGKEWTEAYLPAAFDEAEELIGVARRRKEKKWAARKTQETAQ